jgi:WD40 repeat protein
MRTGRLLSRRKIPGASSGLFFTLDDRQLILPLDHSTRFLDPRSLRTVRTIPGPTRNTALSPDGRTLAAGQKDGSMRFVDLRTGQSRTAVGRHDGSIFSVVFSRDGTHIVTTGADDVALDWNVRSATVVNTLNGFSGCNCGAAISPDGRTLYTDGFNGDVVIWDLDGARRFVRPFLTGAGVPQIPSGAIAPSGHLLAQVSPDGITLFDTRTLQTRARVALPRRGPHPTGAVAFSADGRRVLADVGRGSIAEYRTADGRPAGKPFRTVGPVPIDLAYTRDGSGILELTEGGHVLRIDRPGARPHKLARVPGAGALAVSPRGDVVAVATADGFVVLLDARTGHRQHRFRADPESLSTLAYSHDGRRLVTSGQLGARIFTATGRPLGPTLPGELDAMIDARFSTDDRLVATGSYAGTVRLYDAASGRELASGIKPVGAFVRVFFTPDGRELLGLYGTGDGFRMPVTFGAWARTACRIAGRSLTRAEWQRDVPGQPFAPACT